MAMDYDQSILKARLAQLSPSARVAFAAACATRLVPLYERYSAEVDTGDPRLLHQAIDTVWNWVRGDQIAMTYVAAQIEQLDTLTPTERQAAAPSGAYADDAIASAIYALQSIAEPGAQNAAWAAARVINSVTDFVCARWKRTVGRFPSPDEGFADPAVVTVLARIERDLKELEAAGEGALATLGDRLRARAVVESTDLCL